MISKNSVSWNSNCSNDGLLYFAQRIVEMLDYRSPDIFRVPLLNTISLIKEYIDVDKEHFRKNHLDIILAEFKESFKRDIVISSRWNILKVSQVISKLDKDSSKRTALMNFLYNALSPVYLSWAVNIVRKAVLIDKDIQQIENAIRCFLPELFSKGYDREEVFTVANNVFFSDNNVTDNSLEDFLSFFTCEQRKFNVYIGMKKSMSRFKEDLSKRFGVCLGKEKEATDLSLPKDYFVLVKYDVEAIDAYQAARKVIREIESFTFLYQFIGDDPESLLYSSAFVVSDKGLKRTLNAKWRRFSYARDKDRPNIYDTTGEIISQISQSASCVLPSLEKIVKLHNRAITNVGLENGFLNFWSILEMICISNPELNHIEQVAAKAVPILQDFYFNSIFAEIDFDLSRILEEKILQEIFNFTTIRDVSYEKIAFIILLPEYKARLDTLLETLENYPVLRSRISHINSFCKDRKSLYSLALAYATRIRWHLYRIYRARNAIIHSGDAPAHLKDLGEHLHTYVDIIILELTRFLMSGQSCSLENAMIDCLLKCDSVVDYFSSKSPLEPKSVYDLCLLSNSWLL